jgi:hypothetical protein
MGAAEAMRAPERPGLTRGKCWASLGAPRGSAAVSDSCRQTVLKRGFGGDNHGACLRQAAAVLKSVATTRPVNTGVSDVVALF